MGPRGVSFGLCTRMYMCACLDTDARVHTPVTCTGHTHVDAHTCTRVSWQAWASGEWAGLKRDRTLYDLIDPSVHHSPVLGHTRPEAQARCLACPQQCLQHTYPLQPKDAGMPQKCAHVSTRAYLHAHTLRVGVPVMAHTHIHVYMCTRTPTDMPSLTRLHAHRHVYVQHTCKRVWPSQPRALTFSHRSSALAVFCSFPNPQVWGWAGWWVLGGGPDVNSSSPDHSSPLWQLLTGVA